MHLSCLHSSLSQNRLDGVHRTSLGKTPAAILMLPPPAQNLWSRTKEAPGEEPRSHFTRKPQGYGWLRGRTLWVRVSAYLPAWQKGTM